MDLLLGRFANAHIAELTDAELDEYERLIETADPDLLNWLTGAMPPPPSHNTALFRRLRDFHWRLE